MQRGLWLVLIASAASQKGITGGSDAVPFHYPWMANINFDEKHFCGGVFLSPSALMTAAHCSSKPRGAYSVEFRRYNISAPAASESVQTFQVSKIVVHPEYRGTMAPNDIAIWKLASSIQGPFETIQIGTEDDASKVGSTAIALGWGRSHPNGEFSKALQQVTVPITDFDICSLVWLMRGPSLDKKVQLCAGGQNGKGVCLGDSGGPLFKLQGNTPILLGLTSYGKPCAWQGIPSVFTKVASFSDFIKENS
ncbi:hypothetical protein DSO57_1003353 [Entomophthora muscae]|uniref:Uncharacterized protein n=1 Tax=Entomophthora muscae TaxID=34485 RepID=A0ACC2U6D1_9FUNG|nr:hypothetical protein DSO57_1003353 [Entomophthora muscae]